MEKQRAWQTPQTQPLEVWKTPSRMNGVVMGDQTIRARRLSRWQTAGSDFEGEYILSLSPRHESGRGRSATKGLAQAPQPPQS